MWLLAGRWLPCARSDTISLTRSHRLSPAPLITAGTHQWRKAAPTSWKWRWMHVEQYEHWNKMQRYLSQFHSNLRFPCISAEPVEVRKQNISVILSFYWFAFILFLVWPWLVIVALLQIMEFKYSNGCSVQFFSAAFWHGSLLHDLKLYPATLCIKITSLKYNVWKWERWVSSQHKDGPGSIKSAFTYGIIMCFCDWITIRKYFSAYVYSQVWY